MIRMSNIKRKTRRQRGGAIAPAILNNPPRGMVFQNDKENAVMMNPISADNVMVTWLQQTEPVQKYTYEFGNYYLADTFHRIAAGPRGPEDPQTRSKIIDPIFYKMGDAANPAKVWGLNVEMVRKSGGLNTVLEECWVGQHKHMPLDWKLNITKELLNAGAVPDTNLIIDVNMKDRLQLAQLLISRGADLDKEAANGSTCLMIACEEGNTELARLLIDGGADVNKARRSEGMTALMFAAQRDKIDSVRLLIESGADLDKEDANGSTCLMMACFRGYTEIASLLIDGGADVNKERRNGATALLLAIVGGHIETVKFLINRNANVNKANADGITCLMFAAHRDKIDLVRLLIESGADVDKADAEGSTSLIIACQKGYTELARLLIDGGANINKARSSDGTTALMFAVTNDKIDLVRLLIDKKADTTIKAHSGITAWQMAHKMGRMDIANLIHPKYTGTSTTLAGAAGKGIAAIRQLKAAGQGVQQSTKPSWRKGGKKRFYTRKYRK